MSEMSSDAVLDDAQAPVHGEAPAKAGTLTRTLVGRVVSNKMNKTVTVLIERRVKHPLYGKFMVRSKKYHAHDETNQYNEGDMVEIAETKPMSRTKAWTVTRLIEAARVI